MKCLNCQNNLVRLPTTQGPDLDVCPAGHGLWLDAGEVNCFVEDYRSLTQAVNRRRDVAGSTITTCPRCAIQMDSETAAGTPIKSCGFCHGWWLDRGCLSHLNNAYKGAAVKIHIDETELYTRAAERSKALSNTPQYQPLQSRTNRTNLGFWSLFFVLSLAIASIIFFAGIQKTIQTSRSNPPQDDALIYLILGTIGGLGLFRHGWHTQQRKRLIENIPTSPIRSLALGLVEISGQAQPQTEPLTSPFGGLPCAFYSYTVEERVASGKNTRWETIASGTSEQPFFVQDTTGQVLVVPAGATLVLPDERISRTNWLGDLPPATIDGLKRLGIETHGWIGAKTLRCREAAILPAESVYVLGTALEYHGMSHHTMNESRLYIGSSRDHAFIISDRSEKDLLSRLTWQMWACFLGGMALMATCATMVLNRT